MYFQSRFKKNRFFPKSELCPFKPNRCSTICWQSGSIAARKLVLKKPISSDLAVCHQKSADLKGPHLLVAETGFPGVQLTARDQSLFYVRFEYVNCYAQLGQQPQTALIATEAAVCTGVLGASCKTKYLYSAWLTCICSPSCNRIQVVVYKKKQTLIIGENCLPGQKHRIATFMDITNKDFNSYMIE